MNKTKVDSGDYNNSYQKLFYHSMLEGNEMPNGKNVILLIDDNEDSCELITFAFQLVGYEVVSVNEPKEGLRLARLDNISAIILDYKLAGMTGPELCREIRTFDSHTPIVFYTGATLPEEREAAITAGAQAYLIKPDDFDRLTDVISQTIADVKE